MGQVLQGVVKWFNDAKGFGFIEHESGQDVFVHYSVIDQDGFKTLKDGEPVEYELREGDKGLNASRVSRVNAPASEGEKEGDNAPAESSLSVEVEAQQPTPEPNGISVATDATPAQPKPAE